MLCGEGEYLAQIQQKVVDLDMTGQVLFCRNVKDPEDYLQAMDVFVLPSLFEGLPIVGVEAQASGLPCVFADTITREVGILPESCFVPLSAPDAVWAEQILQRRTPNRSLAVLITRQVRALQRKIYRRRYAHCTEWRRVTLQISVVMTTYNGKEHLQKQLFSLLQQQRAPEEVLIFDDGSTDGTQEEIRTFIQQNGLTNWKLFVNTERKGWKRNFMDGVRRVDLPL